MTILSNKIETLIHHPNNVFVGGTTPYPVLTSLNVNRDQDFERRVIEFTLTTKCVLNLPARGPLSEDEQLFKVADTAITQELFGDVLLFAEAMVREGYIRENQRLVERGLELRNLIHGDGNV